MSPDDFSARLRQSGYPRTEAWVYRMLALDSGSVEKSHALVIAITITGMSTDITQMIENVACL